MEQATVDRLRHQLHEDRGQQLAILDEHGAEPYSDDVDDLGVDSDSFADSAQATEERSELLGQLEFARDRIRGIDQALTRMDQGTYGRCVDCDQTITAERLEARPLSVRCVRCAAEA